MSGQLSTNLEIITEVYNLYNIRCSSSGNKLPIPYWGKELLEQLKYLKNNTPCVVNICIGWFNRNLGTEIPYPSSNKNYTKDELIRGFYNILDNMSSSKGEYIKKQIEILNKVVSVNFQNQIIIYCEILNQEWTAKKTEILDKTKKDIDNTTLKTLKGEIDST